MHVTLLTFSGSRGDVQPFAALGRGLRAAGHEVQFAADDQWLPLAREAGLAFTPTGRLSGSKDELVSVIDAFKTNPVSAVKQLRHYIDNELSPQLEQALHDAWQALQSTDALIVRGANYATGYFLARKRRVPLYLAATAPEFTPTRDFPATGFPAAPIKLGEGAYNRMTFRMFGWMAWKISRFMLKKTLPRAVGDPEMKLNRPKGFYSCNCPVLYGFSESVFPKPADWTDDQHVTGYWFLDRGADWQPPSALVEFLQSGSPPVLIDFGSMNYRSLHVSAALAALRRCGSRGILRASAYDAGRMDTEDELFVLVDNVPYDWLFPRLGAVIHHGGAGTTAAGLRAGIPSILVPFGHDQHTWSRRLHQLGVAPAPISRRKLSVDSIAEGVDHVFKDPAVSARLKALKRRLAAEDGVGVAVRVLERDLLGPRSGIERPLRERSSHR